MLRISIDEIIYMHSEIIKATGGSDGVRDMGLLSSAVNAPFQSFGGYDVYPTIYEKAARLGFGLAQNHAFIDGNKRIAAIATLGFLKGNGINIECTELELYSLFLGLADSQVSFEDLTRWIMEHESS